MDQITGSTEVSSVTLANIAKLTQLYLQEKQVIAPSVTDYSSLVGKGDSSIKLPKFGGFVPEKKISAQKYTLQTVAGQADTLSLDQPWGIRYLIEEFAELESMPDLMNVYAERAALDLALDMDKKISDQLVLASASIPDHRRAYSTGSTLTAADFTLAKSLLRKQNVPMDNNLFLLVSADSEKEILDLDAFASSDKWGSGSEVIKQQGVIGSAYGFKIVVSNAHDGKLPIFYHKSAVCFAKHMGLQMQAIPNNEYGGADVLFRHKYGTVVLDSGKRQVKIGSAS